MHGSFPPKNHNKGMIVYADYAPYPKIKESIEPETVKILKKDYAGQNGEFTAIAQYVFQHGRIKDNPEFANSILKIAIVEMKHLDLLGDAIVALGGNPCFNDNKYFWDASTVNYAPTFKEMIKANIYAESVAIVNYEKHINMIENPSVKALLDRIIEDEKLHLRFFEETLKSLE